MQKTSTSNITDIHAGGFHLEVDVPPANFFKGGFMYDDKVKQLTCLLHDSETAELWGRVDARLALVMGDRAEKYIRRKRRVAVVAYLREQKAVEGCSSTIAWLKAAGCDRRDVIQDMTRHAVQGQLVREYSAIFERILREDGNGQGSGLGFSAGKCVADYVFENVQMDTFCFVRANRNGKNKKTARPMAEPLR
jgi:hypothetical protein